MIRFAVVSILGFSSIEKHDAVQGFCFSDSKGGGYFHRQSSQVTKLGAVGAPTCENDENKGSAQHQPPKKEQTRGLSWSTLKHWKRILVCVNTNHIGKLKTTRARFAK